MVWCSWQAVVLECMRGAHRQQRPCYLYAFSGPGDVRGLEMGTDAAGLSQLLNFLSYSFGGGTDVDAPLDLSLRRIAEHAWSQADILMVLSFLCGPSMCGSPLCRVSSIP